MLISLNLFFVSYEADSTGPLSLIHICTNQSYVVGDGRALPRIPFPYHMEIQLHAPRLAAAGNTNYIYFT